MLNDDELKRFGVDWDAALVPFTGSNRLTRFLNSYLFNAIRNPAYNFKQTFAPVDPKGSYEIAEIIKDSLYKNRQKVSPLTWATIDGNVIGEAEVWFHPDNRKDLLYLRKSFVKKYWFFYVNFQIGAYSDKYDLKIKLKLKS